MPPSTSTQPSQFTENAVTLAIPERGDIEQTPDEGGEFTDSIV